MLDEGFESQSVLEYGLDGDHIQVHFDAYKQPELIAWLTV